MMQDGFDLLAIQNIIWDLRPDVILETGTASGGLQGQDVWSAAPPTL